MKARYLVTCGGREVEGVGRIAKANYLGGSDSVKVWVSDGPVIVIPADQEVTLVPLPGAWLTQSEWLARRNSDRTALDEFFADVSTGKE